VFRPRRFEFNVEDTADRAEIGDENTKLRKLDRETRWMSFLWHSHDFKFDVIESIWPGIKVDDQAYIDHRITVMANTRSYKNQVTSNMVVSPIL
jgi:hypothetical protein